MMTITDPVPTRPGDDVALVRWPAEESVRRFLAAASRPRLLLVDRGAPVPVADDGLEDWVFSSADAEEVRLRCEALAQRAAAGRPGRPQLDDGGLLWHEGRWVSLSPSEERLARALLERYERCVSREVLVAAGGCIGHCSLNSSIKRLRARVAVVGLAISTVHGKGYALSSQPLLPPVVAGPGRRVDGRLIP